MLLVRNLFKFISTSSVKFKNVDNNYWVFGIVLKYPNIRDQLIENLLIAGIETALFFGHCICNHFI